ncbi:hypothetical protein GCM10011339_09750 [Echinicola rosea]|uniref:Uncharacterized protein n=1 Tax=Echinicola rosea TaxID=1807691 RepID=A0ABQ1UP06_9BACT|nr:hypothetical protein GCM10011339_09750 [Echinicola rosea]
MWVYDTRLKIWHLNCEADVYEENIVFVPVIECVRDREIVGAADRFGSGFYIGDRRGDSKLLWSLFP